MSSLNARKKYPSVKTHGGAPAKRINAEAQLRRSVMSCLLWEDEFYEEGHLIAARIASLCERVNAAALEHIADAARNVYHLRHVPLLIVNCMSKRGCPNVRSTINKVVQRPDDMLELWALHVKMGGRHMLPAAMRKGFRDCFEKFDEYQLAKYERDGQEFKLKDVLRMVHPKPRTANRDDLYERLRDNRLERPDTWESALAVPGANKREVFERLILEGRLPYFALLRNLRNMVDARVPRQIVRDAILARRGANRVLPFRYIMAAKYAPAFERELDIAMRSTISELPELAGETVVLVDVSNSMNRPLSSKSDMSRMIAAASLAVLVPSTNARVFTFSDEIVEVPARQGLSGVEKIVQSQPHRWTYLGHAIKHVKGNVPMDRLIVVTDEQSTDAVPNPDVDHAYMINVASAKNGVGYGSWVHLDGFSENIFRFIGESEAL